MGTGEHLQRVGNLHGATVAVVVAHVVGASFDLSGVGRREVFRLPVRFRESEACKYQGEDTHLPHVLGEPVPVPSKRLLLRLQELGHGIVLLLGRSGVGASVRRAATT